jgi:hypothetical protein
MALINFSISSFCLYGTLYGLIFGGLQSGLRGIVWSHSLMGGNVVLSAKMSCNSCSTTSIDGWIRVLSGSTFECCSKLIWITYPNISLLQSFSSLEALMIGLVGGEVKSLKIPLFAPASR